jgi:hypothetical protein
MPDTPTNYTLVVRQRMLRMLSSMPESLNERQAPDEWEPRLIWPGQLVGSKTACERYKIDRSTLSRRITAGDIVPLARLDGAAFVFDLADLPAAS